MFWTGAREAPVLYSRRGVASIGPYRLPPRANAVRPFFPARRPRKIELVPPQWSTPGCVSQLFGETPVFSLRVLNTNESLLLDGSRRRRLRTLGGCRARLCCTLLGSRRGGVVSMDTATAASVSQRGRVREEQNASTDSNALSPPRDHDTAT